MKKIFYSLLLFFLCFGCEYNVYISEQERQFMKEASKGNLAEIELGNVAIARTHNEKVRDFAKLMAKDHKIAQDDLRALADNKKVLIPREPSSSHQALRRDLMTLTGYSFDSLYMYNQIKDHEKMVDLFETEFNDSYVKEYADRYLPRIRIHYEQAREIFNDIQARARTNPSAGL